MVISAFSLNYLQSVVETLISSAHYKTGQIKKTYCETLFLPLKYLPPYV